MEWNFNNQSEIHRILYKTISQQNSNPTSLSLYAACPYQPYKLVASI